MTRGISDPAPIPSEEPEQSQSNDDQPSNSDILNYLDELSDFVREIDVRLATLEKFVIQAPQAADKEITKKKNFFTNPAR